MEILRVDGHEEHDGQAGNNASRNTRRAFLHYNAFVAYKVRVSRSCAIDSVEQDIDKHCVNSMHRIRQWRFMGRLPPSSLEATEYGISFFIVQFYRDSVPLCIAFHAR